MLRERLLAAGFEVRRMFGYQAALLPMLAAARAWSRLRGHRDTTAEDDPNARGNAAAARDQPRRSRAWRIARPPSGSSLVAVARKPGTPR